MKTTVVEPPTEEPLALDAAKDYLRIGHDGEDVLVEALIRSARSRLEAELGLALVSRTLKTQLTSWPSSLLQRGMRLEPAPVSALLGVESVSSSGARDNLTGRFHLQENRLCLRSWGFVSAVPDGGHIEITFRSGFGGADAVPDDLILAVKMLAAQGYHLRDGGPGGAETALPVEIDELLAPYKGVRL